jgi:hypothetical protein
MTGDAPAWKNAKCFRFVRHGYDPASGEARLVYALDDGPELTEAIRFPDAPWPQSPASQAAFARALKLLHAIAGVSYYKTCVPLGLDTAGAPPDEAMAAFLGRLYVEGLAEFAHANQLELEGRVRFRAEAPSGPPAPALGLPARALVAMGGGKDSLVSLELLRSCGLEMQAVCVGHSSLIAETMGAAGMPLLRIGRSLAPELAEMNQAGALNGHVPVTAINSAILLCAAILYGYRYIVFSNERSADEATLTDSRGRAVNHQYSKGLAFERALRSLVQAQVGADIEYFSMLRPFSDLAIAQRFSAMRQYHGVFSSCNRNFHLDGARIEGRWCGACPKCRFTTLMLAPWLAPPEVAAILGADLLDDPGQEDGFRALCRLGVEKPFECVGSIAESRAAMRALGALPGWRDKQVVKTLAAELRDLELPDLQALLKARGAHCIPPELMADVDI